MDTLVQGSLFLQRTLHSEAEAGRYDITLIGLAAWGKTEHAKSDTRKFFLEPLVSADHRRDGLRRLRFVSDQRVGVHRRDNRPRSRDLISVTNVATSVT
jgi:hypothetical protein